jgi:molybdate/tungstate transport system substrate-binding protein
VERSAALRVCHAGALKTVLREEIVPAFKDACGCEVELHGGQSVRLANELRRGILVADLFLSADAQVNALLAGPENGDLVDTSMLLAATDMVIVYNPRSRFSDVLQMAACGALPWYEALLTEGLVFQRNDPRQDPGGYRVVFLCQLAEQFYGIPGLKDRLLGCDDNEAQILIGGYQPLRDGEVDAVITYRTVAIDSNLPFIALPDELNLSRPGFAEWYGQGCYTNPLGQTFRGSPIVFTAAVLRYTQNPGLTGVFVRELLSETGRAALAQHGFSPIPSAVTA